MATAYIWIELFQKFSIEGKVISTRCCQSLISYLEPRTQEMSCLMDQQCLDYDYDSMEVFGKQLNSFEYNNCSGIGEKLKRIRLTRLYVHHFH